MWSIYYRILTIWNRWHMSEQDKEYRDLYYKYMTHDDMFERLLIPFFTVQGYPINTIQSIPDSFDDIILHDIRDKFVRELRMWIQEEKHDNKIVKSPFATQDACMRIWDRDLIQYIETRRNRLSSYTEYKTNVQKNTSSHIRGFSKRGSMHEIDLSALSDPKQYIKFDTNSARSSGENSTAMHQLEKDAYDIEIAQSDMEIC